MAYQPTPIYKPNTSSDSQTAITQPYRQSPYATASVGNTGFSSQQSGTPTYGGTGPGNIQTANSKIGMNPYASGSNQDLSNMFSTSMGMGSGNTAQNTTANWWDNYPTGPSGPSSQTGQQTAYNLPGSSASGGNPYNVALPDWMTGADRGTWKDPKFEQAVSAYGQMLPWYQLGQNAYQYSQDFNENQRRWDNQFGWTQQNDQFNQGLANRQQTQAEQVANWAQQNWNTQFGLDQEIARRNAAVAEQQNRIDEMFKKGQLTNDQYANETARIREQNQLHLGNVQNQISQQNADTQRQNVNNQLHLGNVANQIDQMWKAGQLSNQQRELALAELSQRQNEAFRYAQMANDAGLTREGFANQQKVASMQAFGRAQMPRSRWVRSW